MGMTRLPGSGQSRPGRHCFQCIRPVRVCRFPVVRARRRLAYAHLRHRPVALAEAAADTVSSELGQVFGPHPRMITTLRQVESGTDGAISLIGTLAGVVAAAIVAAAGTFALRGGRTMFAISCAGAVFGLLFDSLLGATLEQRGWLNNDAVNFLFHRRRCRVCSRPARGVALPCGVGSLLPPRAQ